MPTVPLVSPVGSLPARGPERRGGRPRARGALPVAHSLPRELGVNLLETVSRPPVVSSTAALLGSPEWQKGRGASL